MSVSLCICVCIYIYIYTRIYTVNKTSKVSGRSGGIWSFRFCSGRCFRPRAGSALLQVCPSAAIVLEMAAQACPSGVGALEFAIRTFLAAGRPQSARSKWTFASLSLGAAKVCEMDAPVCLAAARALEAMAAWVLQWWCRYIKQAGRVARSKCRIDKSGRNQVKLYHYAVLRTCVFLGKLDLCFPIYLFSYQPAIFMAIPLCSSSN